MKESIKEAIQNGILKPGDKLPTEHEICNHFNLSRTVTRQAFYELMSEGYIVRYKSRGTFVNQQSKENVFFKEIISFNDEMKMYGFEPKTELISIRNLFAMTTLLRNHVFRFREYQKPGNIHQQKQ